MKKCANCKEENKLENTGCHNSGDYNSGNSNSGDYNSGYCNSGDYNSGYCNSGWYNSGWFNSGNSNSGHHNSGNSNSGDYNSGYCNSGDYNSGYCNSGWYNSGWFNSGNSNSGDYNSGNSNSGDCNSGNRNSGWFNTNEPKMRFFNKDSEYTYSEFSKKFSFISPDLKICSWVEFKDLDKSEQSETSQQMGGLLKTLSYKEAWKEYWSRASESDKEWFTTLPNFDEKIFEEITGIKISATPSLSGKEVTVNIDGKSYVAVIK